MSLPSYVKAALMMAAQHRNMRDRIGQSPPIREPRIVREHIDGPYIRHLDGTLRWLTLWERLLTKIGTWDAWDIELIDFPNPDKDIAL